jgi:hypothetical protein
MTLEEIKAELTSLTEEQQNHLAAYLVHLRHQRDSGSTETTGVIDNGDAGQWVSVDELKEKWKD